MAGELCRVTAAVSRRQDPTADSLAGSDATLIAGIGDADERADMHPMILEDPGDTDARRDMIGGRRASVDEIDRVTSSFQKAELPVSRRRRIGAVRIFQPEAVALLLEASGDRRITLRRLCL
jgi:hypothetical protein